MNNKDLRELGILVFDLLVEIYYRPNLKYWHLSWLYNEFKEYTDDELNLFFDWFYKNKKYHFPKLIRALKEFKKMDEKNLKMSEITKELGEKYLEIIMSIKNKYKK